MANKIFINYRRALNLKDAQLLEKILQRKFGAGKVFLDTSGLEGGKHWLHTLEAQVDASSAMVSLIGQGWADARDESGARRLDNPDDFVRFEIARAFSRKIPVLPVLIDGAAMPDKNDLPNNLLPLLFVQAMPFRALTTNDDGEKIANRLAALIEEAKPRILARVDGRSRRRGARGWHRGRALAAKGRRPSPARPGGRRGCNQCPAGGRGRGEASPEGRPGSLARARPRAGRVENRAGSARQRTSQGRGRRVARRRFGRAAQEARSRS